MDQASRHGELRDLSVCAWMQFWVPFVLLGLAAGLAAIFAGQNNAPGNSTCAVVVIVAAFLLALMRLKNYFDDSTSGWGDFLLVSDVPSLIAMIVVFVIVAVIGLFLANANEQGGLHVGGIALFVASGIGVFLSLKHVYDNLDRQH